MIKTSLIALVSAALSTAVGAVPNNVGRAEGSSFAVTSTAVASSVFATASTVTAFPSPTVVPIGGDSDLICFPVDTGFYFFGGANSTDGSNSTTSSGTWASTSTFYGNFTTTTAAPSQFSAEPSFSVSTTSFVASASSVVFGSSFPPTAPISALPTGASGYPAPYPTVEAPRLICFPRSAGISLGHGSDIGTVFPFPTATAFPSGETGATFPVPSGIQSGATGATSAVSSTATQ